MKRFPKTQFDSGYTLIEMLIAIAVSGIVLAGLVSVFATANRAYTRQDETATMQQNLRVAKMNMERDIRMAGCGFGNTFNYLSGYLGNPNPNPIYPLTNINADPLNANSDSLTISYVNYSDPCIGVLPQLTPSNDVGTITFPGTTATITVNNNLNSTGNPPFPAYSSWKTIPASPCTGAGQFLAVYTRSVSAFSTTLRSDVFAITGIVAGLAPNTFDLQCSNLSNTIETRQPPVNSIINFFSATQLVTITYSFDSVNRTLRRNQQPANVIAVLAEDIENLQFAFGLDTDANGSVDLWINNAVLVPAQQAQIRQVRVSILGRSTNPINGHTLNARPAIEDNGAGTVQDRHLRQLLQFDVALRNLS
ncbi:MAG: PilW family protein [Deltaproteobacteria bacterium]